MSEAVHARRFLVSGMVQGVGFRYFVQYAAEGLKLAGYVRNRRDGRVEAYAIGTGEQLAAFRMALETGPHGARVSSVQEEPTPVEENHAKDFVIANTV